MKIGKNAKQTYEFIDKKENKTATRIEIHKELGIKYSAAAYPLAKKGILEKFKKDKKVNFKIAKPLDAQLSTVEEKKETQAVSSEPSAEKIQEIAEKEFEETKANL